MEINHKLAQHYKDLADKAYKDEQERDADIPRYNRVYVYDKAAKLVELGLTPEFGQHGLYITSVTKPWKHYIIAINTNKWCNANKYKWYYYKTLEDLVNNIILK